jgi:hypothetical protein
VVAIPVGGCCCGYPGTGAVSRMELGDMRGMSGRVFGFLVHANVAHHDFLTNGQTWDSMGDARRSLVSWVDGWQTAALTRAVEPLDVDAPDCDLWVPGAVDGGVMPGLSTDAAIELYGSTYDRGRRAWRVDLSYPVVRLGLKPVKSVPDRCYVVTEWF